jgi:hypothetical protein
MEGPKKDFNLLNVFHDTDIKPQRDPDIAGATSVHKIHHDSRLNFLRWKGSLPSVKKGYSLFIA